jgi:hypothetical protein
MGQPVSLNTLIVFLVSNPDFSSFCLFCVSFPLTRAAFSCSLGHGNHAMETHLGTFKVYLPKATPGEHFEGLDLLTVLLARKAKPAVGAGGDGGVVAPRGPPVIEVLGSAPASNFAAGSCGGVETISGPADESVGEAATAGALSYYEEDEDEEEIDWETEQQLAASSPIPNGLPCFFFSCYAHMPCS